MTYLSSALDIRVERERVNVFTSIPSTGILGAMLYNLVNEIDPSKSIQKVPALRDLMQTLTAQVCIIQLRGYWTSNQKSACFVLYLKFINTFMDNNKCIL